MNLIKFIKEVNEQVKNYGCEIIEEVSDDYAKICAGRG